MVFRLTKVIDTDFFLDFALSFFFGAVALPLAFLITLWPAQQLGYGIAQAVKITGSTLIKRLPIWKRRMWKALGYTHIKVCFFPCLPLLMVQGQSTCKRLLPLQVD